MDATSSNIGHASLDLVFIMDCTGSMGSYISSATQNIELICEEIVQSEKLATAEALRLAIVAYRDHPPQDSSYITKILPFTSNVNDMKTFLKSLYASGGGDGPEAVTAAMQECLSLDWRPDASKMTVLIADAPPHGIGEYGDGFSQGDPCGQDPLQIARLMATQGIAFFVVACEPALSQYSHATDFFRALSQISAGMMLPLTNAALLARVIVGSALEHLDMERLIQEVGAAVAQKIHGNQENVDDVARQLHETLLLRNENTKQLVVENIYRDTPEGRHNVDIWMNAPDLASAKPHIKRITGSRFTDKYLEQRYGRSPYRSAPPVPPRATTASPEHTTGITSSPSSTSGAPSTSPSSPSRKVVSSFAAFSAPKMSLESTPFTTAAKPGAMHSMFGSFGASSAHAGPASSGTGLASAYGGMRDGGAGAQIGGSAEDDEEDEQDGIQLRMGGISLDQAKRITLQSAWRGLRT